MKKSLKKSKILRVGIIGCGDIFLSHSQAYPDHLHAVPIAFYDRIKSRAINWKHHMERYLGYVKEAAEDLEEDEDHILMEKVNIFEDQVKVYNSIEDLIENVDAIDICTPNYAHIPYAIWALEKNKSVMSEKPPARCSYETKKLVDAQNKSQGFYQLNENFLWKTSVRKLNELIKSGKIGKISLLKTSLGHGGPSWGWNHHFHNPSLSGGGCLSDMGIHAIGYGYGAIGPNHEIVSVSSLKIGSENTPERRLKDSDGLNEYYLTKFMVEDHAKIKVTLEDNETKHQFDWIIKSSWAKTFNEFEITGELGSLTVEKDEKNRQIIIYTNTEGEREEIEIPPQGRDDHQLEVVDFFNKIGADPAEPPHLGAKWAHKMQSIISAAYLSNLKKFELKSEHDFEITLKDLDEFYQSVVNSGCPETMIVEEIVWRFMSPITAKYFKID